MRGRPLNDPDRLATRGDLLRLIHEVGFLLLLSSEKKPGFTGGFLHNATQESYWIFYSNRFARNGKKEETRC